MAWDHAQYLKFAQPRLRPAVDLLARIALEAPRSVYDLGCGAGNITRLLAARWHGAAITGVDASAAMLDEAASVPSRIVWREQSVGNWAPDAPAELIYSNAALHWLSDHAALFPRLMRALAPRGVLAVQMPRNFAAPSHTLVAAIIRAGPWQNKLEHLLRPEPVNEPSFYYKILAPLAASVDIWECEYLQPLRGDNPVKEFVKGSYLKQFLDVLESSERAAFEDQYAMRCLRAGASAYINKDSAPEELAIAARKVLAGGRYVGASLAERLVSKFDESIDRPRHERLSDRELEVLLMIAAGVSLTEIADRLHVSAKTVSSYRARLLDKMQMTNNAEVTRYAVAHRLID